MLRSAGSGLERSGPTNPQLHVFAADGTEIATTDGARYQFSACPAHPASDPQAAAAGLSATLGMQRSQP